MQTVAQKSPCVQTAQPQAREGTSIEEIAKHLQEVLGEKTEELARKTNFVKRRSPITGKVFAQALIMGWLAMPDASYSQLQQMLEVVGCDVSAQALEQRMTKEAGEFLKEILHQAVEKVVIGEEVTTEILQRFNGVFTQDGSVIGLPKSLEHVYQGFGGNTEESGKSGMRAQIRLNLNNGEMQGPWIKEARACEREGEGSFEELPPPVGSLSITDTGYFTLLRMRWMTETGKWWLTHAKANLLIFDERGVKYTLVEYIKKNQHKQVIDAWVTIGNTSKTRQEARLMAFRVSDQRAQQRREQQNKNTQIRAKGSRRDVQVGKRRQRPSQDGRHRRRLSAKRMKLIEWTILLTNVPQSLLAPHEARALVRARWQIELIWRLWKERGMLDIWRSTKDTRILCEIYAKLIGMLFQQWFTILGCWSQPDRSMVKASMAVQLLTPSLALALSGPMTLQDILSAMKRAMYRATINSSKKRQRTCDLLKDPLLTAS